MRCRRNRPEVYRLMGVVLDPRDTVAAKTPRMLLCPTRDSCSDYSELFSQVKCVFLYVSHGFDGSFWYIFIPLLGSLFGQPGVFSKPGEYELTRRGGCLDATGARDGGRARHKLCAAEAVGYSVHSSTMMHATRCSSHSLASARSQVRRGEAVRRANTK